MRIGTDLVELTRIEQAIQNGSFLFRVFTEKERDHAAEMSGKRRIEFLAGRFAVKEAVAKALGTGIGASAGWKEIETLPGDRGEPCTRLTGQALACMNHLGLSQVHVSISHAGGLAMAFVVFT